MAKKKAKDNIKVRYYPAWAKNKKTGEIYGFIIDRNGPYDKVILNKEITDIHAYSEDEESFDSALQVVDMERHYKKSELKDLTNIIDGKVSKTPTVSVSAIHNRLFTVEYNYMYHSRGYKGYCVTSVSELCTPMNEVNLHDYRFFITKLNGKSSPMWIRNLKKMGKYSW